MYNLLTCNLVAVDLIFVGLEEHFKTLTGVSNKLCPSLQRVPLCERPYYCMQYSKRLVSLFMIKWKRKQLNTLYRILYLLF